MRILGLDVGDVRIGVALSDTTGAIASPLEVIDRVKTSALKRIDKIIQEYQIKKVVIGLPKSLDDSEKVQAKKVRNFSKKLKNKIVEIDIVFFDERYSTVAANRLLNEATKKNAKEKRKVVDKVAATIILQTYLEMTKSKEEVLQ